MLEPMTKRQMLERRIKSHVHAQEDRNRAALKSVREKISGLNGPSRAHPTPEDWPPEAVTAETPRQIDFLTACWIVFVALVGRVAFRG
ncbi:MAG: hypothetical protein AAFY34_10350 [Pseudomonadota bacterium]